MKNNIRNLLKKSGSNTSSIIKKAGVGKTSFYEIMNGSQLPRIDTAIKIANALDSRIDEVFPELRGGM